MSRLSSVLVAGLLPFLGTCCPTLWLQVEKDNPSPWPSVAIPPVEQTPYNLPPGSPNRFDVLVGGQPTVAFAGYTDSPDPKDDANSASSRAVADLASITKCYGRPAPPSCAHWIDATLLCADPAVKDCSGILLHQLPLPAAAVLVKTKDGASIHAAVLNPLTIPVIWQRVFPRDPLKLRPVPKGLNLGLEISASIQGQTGDSVQVCALPDLGLSRTLLSFIHMSDIQLRDPSVTLTDRRLSHSLDWFDALNSFEYDEDLASYNQYVTEAVFATINSLVHRTGTADDPKFVIHTGDSIDSGVTSELVRFHTLVDRLRIPFFELFGNHDVLSFGNLTPTITHATDKNCTTIAELVGGKHWFVPHRLCVDQWILCPTCIGKEGVMVAQTTQEATRQFFIKQLYHPRTDRVAELHGDRTENYCDHPTVKVSPYTFEHGFDLGTSDGTLDGKALGYYAFAVPLANIAGRNAVFIGLNSEDLHDAEGGTSGRLGKDQVEWLKGVLECVKRDHPADLAFVFAHQPLSEIQIDPDKDHPESDPKLRLARILEAYPNVIAFLRGHNHWHSICDDGGRKDKGVCSHFWEVETASLIEFPQEGRIVRIKQVSDELAYLEVTALRERLVSQDSELARYVALGRKGAERDFCYTKRETPNLRCSPDQRPYRTDGRDANARLFFRLPVAKPPPSSHILDAGCPGEGVDPRLQRAIDLVGQSEQMLRDAQNGLGVPDLELAGPGASHKTLVYRNAKLSIELARAPTGEYSVSSVGTGAIRTAGQLDASYDGRLFGIRHGMPIGEVRAGWGPGDDPKNPSRAEYPANFSTSSGRPISVVVLADAKRGVYHVEFRGAD
jgi:hypothetical protein